MHKLLVIFLALGSILQAATYHPSMVCVVNPDSVVTSEPDSAFRNRRVIEKTISQCGHADPQNDPDWKRIVLLGSGTYYIDSTIEFEKVKSGDTMEAKHFIILTGKEKDSTTLVLKSGVAATTPIVMIRTEEEYNATAFSNGIWDLTLDAGTNNQNASGIEWQSNNWGSIKNVKVRSTHTTPNGVGIIMTQSAAGPTLLKNVTVEGFKYGIQTKQNHAGIVMEKIILEGQYSAGIRNCLNALTIRNLQSSGSNPVIQNYLCDDMGHNSAGMITLMDGNFTNGSSNFSAIENTFVGPLPSGVSESVRHGSLYLKNVSASGFGSMVKFFPGNSFQQLVFGKNLATGLVVSMAPTTDPSPLEVKETPEFEDPNLSNWVSVPGGVDTGPNDSWDNDTLSDVGLVSTLASMDGSESTLFFPPNNYFPTNTITIPAKVKRIIGYGATLYPKKGFTSKCRGDSTYTPPPGCDSTVQHTPLFKIEGGGSSDTLFIDGLDVGTVVKDLGKAWMDKLIVFQHLSTRPVKISFCRIAENTHHAKVYVAGPSAGSFFIENVFSTGISGWELRRGQSVWARQWDPEGNHPGDPKILSDSAKVWVLGLKTENNLTAFKNISGGQAEIYGGYLIPVETADIPLNIPAFENINSKLTLVYAHNKTNHGYLMQIRDVQGSVERLIKTDEVQYHGDLARVMSFYSAPSATSRPTFDRGGGRILPVMHLLHP